METPDSYENYPVYAVLMSNLVSILIYVLGFLIISTIGIVYSFLYMAYVLFLEIRLVRNHCTNCYYYGKTCGFGKGRLSALFFRKGDANEFCNMSITWKSMLPDVMVSLVPIAIGVILLIIDFDLLTLSAMAGILVLTTFGNSYIRGTITCKYCRQRELGCPAYLLFDKRN